MIPGWEHRLRRHLADIACGKGVPRRRMYGRTDSQFVHRLNYQSEFQIDARTGYFFGIPEIPVVVSFVNTT